MIELSFHEAIRSGDKVANLIYADWLEDNGREVEAAILRSGHWRLVPAGSFWMGGGGGEAGNKQVEIPHSFFMGTYPVTQEEWQAVMGNNPSCFSRQGDGKKVVKSICDDDLKLFPVEEVSWDDVQAFLQKLNGREKAGDWVYCLPTEQEWEYACRGGASSKSECSFHFYLEQPTNDLTARRANFNGNHPFGNGSKGPNLKRPCKVGSYKPNCLGIYDMHGNVHEWTDSLMGSERVIRGGSGFDSGKDCRASTRYSSLPFYRPINVGFRLALVLFPR